ncbi:hydrolase [Neorhizobium sp. NCHU2750]|uniref:hydrolase n=1 Tax=Neorhizobium sp. NCHU2750 TaxID=1825976 RepID=UPI000E733EF9|nr:hydrolase [Neorhizobium sp. NCHU2750]
MLALDPKTTALVLIDLQKGILAMNTAPHASADVLAKGRALAETFRKANAPVVLVNVDFGPDFGDAPRGLTDASAPRNYPEGWTELDAELKQPGDLTVTKRQWGAFHGTDLDVKLRRRGIQTIVVGGIATNFGVESTVRAGWEHGYNVVVVEDASTGVSAELHDMAFKFIFPRIARVTTTADLTLG